MSRQRKRHLVADAAPAPRSTTADASLAMDIDFVIDGGATARCVAGRPVAGRSTAAGPYLLPESSASAGRAVATNAPPHGASAGFGAPQSLFALERHMDRVAAAAGLAPEEFRRRNFIQSAARRAQSVR